MSPDGALARLLGALVTLGAACWLCIYPVAMVCIGLAFLVVIPQGHELLEAMASDPRVAHKVLFYVAVGLWAFGAWYCSRVLLKRRFHGRFASTSLESDDLFTRAVRIWLPRLLGAVIYAALAGYFLMAGDTADGVLTALCGLAYGAWVLYRRAIVPDLPPAAARVDELDRTTHWILALALGGSFALLACFLLSPVHFPRQLGAAPIALLALTSWMLFGTIVLVLMPKAYGLPSLALAPLVLALAAGNVDNHEVRQAVPEAGVQRPASIQAAALQWLRNHGGEFRSARSRGDDEFPVYIVSAEGGGLRAAYWTANVLGELDLASGGRFSERLFAISSVSGGSLAAAAFVAQLSTPGCTAPDANVRNCLRWFLNDDFLSPVGAYMLFPDLMQRFMPLVPIRIFDRARGLELSWERSWEETHPGRPNAFAARYEDLAKSGALPRLFFNGARVETGKRVLVSPVAFDQDELPEVDDLLAVGGKRWTVPLSTAVHLSARFTYVSPAAKICADAAETCSLGEVWGRIVDGGYHENSGAQTAEGLLAALRRAAREFEASQPAGRTRIAPRVVIITNDASSRRICDAPAEIEPSHWFAEFLAPALALWNSRVARGTQARRELADAAAGARRDPLGKDCAGDRTRANTLEFSLASAYPAERPPALGWFLAVGSTRRMDQAICSADHTQAIALLRRDLGVTTPYSCAAAPPR
ncbi:MAG TPA: hypothetical protein VEU32_21785 [Burkholderiales bacterium]|nr:hypothetical protein [Burkholderiales bacterium]